MKFLTDYTAVTFTGIEKAFNVYSTFVEFTIPFVNIDVSIKFYGLIIAFGFLLAVLFGGVGSTAGMYVFRHKTRHWYFKVFMPCLAVIDIVALALLCVYVA